jgi:ribokinase
MTMIDAGRERTIVTFGERLEPHGADPLPWELMEDADVAYVTAGDPAAFEAARRARLLVVTSRGLASLEASGVAADVLVGSGRDRDEAFDADSLAHRPGLIVRTEGLAGGSWEAGDERHRWKRPFADPEGGDLLLPSDAYGAGDSFVSGLAYGLAAGMEVPEAIRLAARCGAACASGRGPFTAQLTQADLASDS